MLVHRVLGPTLSLAAAAILAAGCISGPSTQTPAPSTVVIGILTDMGTGNLDAARGSQLAVDIVNGSFPNIPIPLAASVGLPDLHGARLTLVTADTHGDAGKVSDAAATLVNQGHASTIIVTGAPEVAAAAGSAAKRLSVPVIDAANTADYITDLGLEWYFRAGPSDQMLVETALAAVHRQVGGPARIAMLTATETTSAGVAELVTDLATRSGDTVTRARPSATPGTPKPSSEPAQVYADQFDVIFALAGTPAEAADVRHAAAGMTRRIPILCLGTGFDEVTPSTRDSTLFRAVPWSAEFALRSPPARGVMTEYQRRFSATMTLAAASSFIATMIAAIAIDEAVSADPAEVRNALRRLSLPATEITMPWNGVQFDASGQNRLAAGVIEAMVAGHFEVVYPRELAAGPMVWPTATGPKP